MKISNLNAEDLGLCVCGRRIYADTTCGAVLHEVPYCKAFEQLDPLDFFTYVRQSRGIPDEAVHSLAFSTQHKRGS